MGPDTFAFTDENFSSATAEGLSLIDLYADWCGPCKMMAPVIDRVATQFKGRAVVGKLNVDECPETAQALGVTSIPTLVFFKNGEEVARSMGVQSEVNLTRQIETLLKK